MGAGACRECGEHRASTAGGLCPDHEPVLCTCEFGTPGKGFWHEHECQVCKRLLRPEDIGRVPTYTSNPENN